MLTNKALALAAITTVAAGAAVLYALPVMSESKYESPRYEVVRVLHGGVEIRRYAPRTVAEVSVSATGRRGMDAAFGVLAGYIFGKNKPKVKIAMTTPVATQFGGSADRPNGEKIPMTSPVLTGRTSNALVMQFFMPSAYSLESLPEPLDDRIKFRQVPAETYAAMRFSGGWSQTHFDRQTERLIKLLSQEKVASIGEPLIACYNPPFTPPFLRHNEVMVRLP